MGERGDIILSGLLRTTLALLFIALIVFEIGAVIVNQVQLDRAAQLAARDATRTYDTRQSQPAAEEAAQAALRTLDGSILLSIDIDDRTVTVTIARPAPVLLVDRIPVMRDRLHGTATASARPVG